jgi:ABC-2 type transport system permease protein
MIRSLRRQANVYGAFAAMVPKQYLAYTLWVWMEYVLQIVSMLIFVYFWRAVYANATAPLGGLTLQQTINYILLAQIMAPLAQNNIIFDFGFLLQSGQMAVELVRPVDFQLRYYVAQLASLVMFALQKLPLLLLAWLAFGLQLPAEAGAWGAFGVSLVLGASVIFMFDTLFACLAFYTTETWGLSVVRNGVSAFFSGALLPLSMLPDWLARIGSALPFAQALYVPASFLSGITPPSAAPRVWLIQLLWLAGLWAASRAAFNIAVRKVTVQGG